MHSATPSLQEVEQKAEFQSTHKCIVRLRRDDADETKMGFQSTHKCIVRQPWWDAKMVRGVFQSTHKCIVRRDVITDD